MQPQTKLRVAALIAGLCGAAAAYGIYDFPAGMLNGTALGFFLFVGLFVLSAFVFLPIAFGCAVASTAVGTGQRGGFVFRANRVTRYLGMKGKPTICRTAVEACVPAMCLWFVGFCILLLVLIVLFFGYQFVAEGYPVAIATRIVDGLWYKKSQLAIALLGAVCVFSLMWVIIRGLGKLFRWLDSRCIRMEN